MALNNNALITLNQAKRFVGYPTTDVSQDDLFEEFINETSEMIERYCCQKFAIDTYTEFFDGNGKNEIIPSNFPIVSVTELHDDLNREFLTPIDSSNYAISGNNFSESFFIKRFDNVFTRGKQNVKIVYEAGYSVIPSDLQLACKIALAFYYNKQQQKDWTTATKSKGDENTTFLQGIPKAAIDIIEKYKRLEIAGEDISPNNY